MGGPWFCVKFSTRFGRAPRRASQASSRLFDLASAVPTTREAVAASVYVEAAAMCRSRRSLSASSASVLPT